MISENILVVKRTSLFKDTAFNGLRADTGTNSFLNIINEQKEFLPRAHMEEDPAYKQIIPYLVFTHKNKYFLMQRTATSSEQRLKNKYSLGIGGHMRQEDMHEGNTIFDWAKREFNEEISYQSQITIHPLGILNDDSNEVGKVHLGLVLLLEGDSPNIAVKSELKSGQLVTLDECANIYSHMETWSQIIFNYLKK